MKVTSLIRAFLLPLAMTPCGAWAQYSGSNQASISQPSGTRELQDAMRRIAVDPTNADALVDAGNASLLLGDAKSALNFFTRANALRPNDGRILAGLGSASVRTENPFEALRLFDEAVKRGIQERVIAADRALAFDLLGNFGRAQQDYQMARSGLASDDLIVKQAVSLSLSGKHAEADGMLIPLLDRQVPAAWRARAFILAARGEVKESSRVAAGFLDANSLQRVERYLRLMPELTDAQKAAAIHLGHFPQSYEIGRDSEQVKRVAATIPAAGSDRLIPTGAPLGTKAAAVPLKKETASERRKREKEEKNLAAAAAKLEARKKSEPVRVAAVSTKAATQPVVSTPAAKARLEQAQASKVTVVSGQLPPPENARPLVDVAAPAQKLSDTAPIAAPPVTKVAIASPPSGAQLPTPNPTSSMPQSISTASSSVPVSVPVTQLSVPIGPPVRQPDPVASQTPQIASVSVAPSNVAPPATTSASAPDPGFASISSPVIASPATSAVAAGSLPTSIAPAPITAASVTPPQTAQAAPTPATSPASDNMASFDLGAVVASISIPESEQHRAVAPVDLSKIKPAAPKAAAAETPAKAEKSKAPTHPARSWVQVATGNASAFSYDFKQMAKKSPELFSGLEGWSSDWGNNDRLLVGPFGDLKDAKKWESDFRKEGGNGFVWQSDDGTVVDKVAGANAPKVAAPTTTKQPAKATGKTTGKSATTDKKGTKAGSTKESTKPAAKSTGKPKGK